MLHDGSIITTSIANIIPLELCETRSNVAPVGDDQLGDITCDPLSTSIDDLDEPSINDDDNSHFLQFFTISALGLLLLNFSGVSIRTLYTLQGGPSLG